MSNVAIVNLSARNNQDFILTYSVSTFLASYPNADFRMQMRDNAEATLVRYQWTLYSANSFSGKIALSSGSVVVTAPAADMEAFAGPYVYDLRLEDSASGAKLVVFGGTITFDDGVTI